MALDVRKADQAPAVADRFRELHDQLSKFPEEKFIRLVPAAAQEFSPFFRPVFTVVDVDADPKSDARDVYVPAGGRGDQLALHATALQRIANALAITWEPSTIAKSGRWTWDAQAAGWLTHPNGDRVRITAGYTLDVEEDGVIAKRARSKAANTAARATNEADKRKATDDAERDIDSYRQYGPQRAETGAQSRVISKAAGMKKTYTARELATKRFVAVLWRPDESHPEVAQVLLKRMESSTAEVFGGRQVPQLAPGTVVHEVDAGHGSEDEIVGAIDTTAHVTDAPAADVEPEIPEAETPAPAFDIEPLRAQLEAIRSRLRIQDGAVSDEQLLAIGTALRDVLELRGRNVAKERYKDVRLAIVRALWGDDITTAKALTVRQAQALITWLADDAGKQQVRVLFDHLLATDAEFASTIGVQQTLADAVAS